MNIDDVSIREIEYLIKVFELEKKRGYVRIKDLVNELKLAKPTVSLTVKKLVKKGVLAYLMHGKVKLTKKGLFLIYESIWRHGVIEFALTKIGLKLDEACVLTERIQAKIPREAVEKLWLTLGMPNKCSHGLELPTPPRFKPDKRYMFCKPRI
jgi:Mn-dependent DtxR family transcriptional regulator